MKYIVIFIMLFAAWNLMADVPEYYPLTTIAEDFGANWCTGCQQVFLGLDAAHAQTHFGEFISARLYTESGMLTNQDVLDRFDHYQVFGIPTVIFNGKTYLEGNIDDVASGAPIMEALAPYRFAASPLKMKVTSFNANSGLMHGTAQIVTPGFVLNDAQLFVYLVEDDVTDQDTHVTRQIFSETISLDAGELNFTAQFEIRDYFDNDKLWAAAFIQTENNTILQTAHSLPLPETHIRAAMDWSTEIVEDPAVSNYLSQPFWIFNLGMGSEFNTRIEVDDAPDDWYFNYCDEEGNCFPGGFAMPHVIPPNTAKAFHLNLMVYSSGIGKFRYVINSPALGDYSIPFEYRTSDMVSADDALAPQVSLSLHPNHPNPFKHSTTLRLSSDKPLTNAIIDIYNLKGQKVDSITLDNVKSGNNDLVWNADSSLPSGVYLQKLRGSDVPPQRMLLLK